MKPVKIVVGFHRRRFVASQISKVMYPTPVGRGRSSRDFRMIRMSEG
jgi:hypothetical protein